MIFNFGKNLFVFTCSLIFFLSINNICSGWTGDWNSIHESTHTIQTIKSAFTQEKQLPLLKKPLISKGIIYFDKPDSLRWEYLTPVNSILISHKGDIERYFMREGIYIKDAGAHLEAMQIVLLEIGIWLSGQFDKSPNFVAELKNDGRILLTPKNKQVIQLIRRITLELSIQPGIIKSVTIFENESSYTKLRFENTILNEPIENKIFQEP